jgi:tetratricopeptide (TPR) repeat protein
MTLALLLLCLHAGPVGSVAGALSHARPVVSRQAPGAGVALAPRDTLERIAGLLDRNDLAGARGAVETALGAYPDDPALHNFAGAIEAQAGEFAKAEPHFLTAIRLAPEQPAPYENLGRLYQERTADDPTARGKALDIYRRLLVVAPSDTEGLYQAGFLLALDGKFADSRALIEKLPAEIRRRPHALAISSVDAAGSGDQAGATAAARELEAHPDLSAADVMAVVPAFGHLEGHDEVAVQLLEALDHRGIVPSDGLQLLGELYIRHLRFADARQVLERAATLGGPTVPALVDLARAADRLGDHKGALGYLAHARALEPANANVHFMFGMVCVELDLVAEAYQSLKKAVELAPDNPLVNYAMGAASMHRHEPSESLPYFEKYIQLKPDDPRGRFALGVARFYSKQFDRAKADLELAVRHPETAGGGHYFLAKIARQANDLDTARREADQAVRLTPTYADAWAELGLIQTRAGAYGDAERSLDKALALDPQNYSATVNLAMLYARTKDPRREAQAARLQALQEKRDQQAQELLRIVKVVP